MPQPRKLGTEVPCPVCGIVKFHTNAKMSRAGQRHYCSQACYLVGRFGGPAKRKTTCDRCGAAIDRYIAPGRSGRAFCSRACHLLWRSAHQSGENSPGWRGGDVLHYGGTHWKRQRRLARERDGRCVDCGATEQRHGYALDVHHVEPYPRDGTAAEKHHANRLENLITLCRPCHVRRERLVTDD